MTDDTHRAAARAASEEAARRVGDRARADLARLTARPVVLPELMAGARETVEHRRARRALLAEALAEQDAADPTATWRMALG